MSSDDRRILFDRMLAQKGLARPAVSSRIARRPPGPAPTSLDQYRLWLQDQLEPGSALYNDCLVARLVGGELDVDRVERALREVVRRHEILRTTFEEEAGVPVQVVHDDAPVTLSREDLRPSPPAEREARLAQLVRQQVEGPFDIRRLPLLRAALVRMAADDHALVVTMHHIVSDGVSFGILYRELEALYADFERGRTPSLPALGVQFADFAAWERATITESRLAGALDYWRKALGADPPVLDMPTDRPRSGRTGQRGALRRFRFPDHIVSRLREGCRREQVTPYVALLAAYGVLLHAHSRQRRVLVGTPSSGRRRVELEPLIGFFIHTLPVVLDLEGNPTFRELLDRVRRTVLEAFAHDEVPFERIAAGLRRAGSPGQTDLLRAWFCHMKDLIPPPRIGGLRGSYEVADTGRSRFELSLILDETADGIRGWFEFDAALFEEATIAGFQDDYIAVLRQGLDYPATTVASLASLVGRSRRSAPVARPGLTARPVRRAVTLTPAGEERR